MKNLFIEPRKNSLAQNTILIKTLTIGFIAIGLNFAPAKIANAQHHDHSHHNHVGHDDDNIDMTQTVFGNAHHHNDHFGHGHHTQTPMGVMGAHMHDKGEWMISYRYMHMTMRGNRIGSKSVSPDTIATTVTNPFAGPPTLRVVPTDMTMDMHMLGVMYAPTDDLTLMVMVNYLHKEMDHITYMGAAGTTVRGMFTTESEGFGDTKLSGLYRLYDDGKHHLHANIGLSIPTGTITETDNVLAPTGATPRLRLPYAMQLGTGTFDALPGLTYTGHENQWGWGTQYTAEIRLEDENDEGYSHGDRHQITGWGTYQWNNALATSLRLTGWTQDNISGQDNNIAAPVQTADPDNYGGKGLDLGLGFTITGTEGFLKHQTVGIEATLPVYRDLNGPQLETDFTLSAGLQFTF